MSRILLVESDAGERLVLRSRLADLGHSVDAVANHADAIELAGSQPFDLALIAFDLEPASAGPDVCVSLRRVAGFQTTPILMFCRKAVDEDAYEEGYIAGCDLFVAKQQVHALERIIATMMRTKNWIDELREQNRLLNLANQRLMDQRRHVAESDERGPSPAATPLAKPDGVLVVDATGVIRHADRGARELFNCRLEARSLGSVAPGSGLEAFVRDARSVPRQGFRFDLELRGSIPPRSLLATVVPLSVTSLNSSGSLRVVLVANASERPPATAENARVSGVPQQQLGSLLEAARELYSPQTLNGRSAASQKLAQRVVEVAAQPGSILIEGERGTGKRLVASVAHYSSSCNGALLEFACGSLSPESIEKDLFGYARGAFAGAVVDHAGLLFLAHGGAVVLTEIAELPLACQERLAAMIETGRILPRGADELVATNTRVIATSSIDLEQAVRDGRFSSELLRRLSPNTIKVPALRERIDDVPSIALHLLERCGADRVIDERALWVMQQYDWPGNIRELEDVVERACERNQCDLITVDDLSTALRGLAEELPQDRDLIPAVRPVSATGIRVAVASGGANGEPARLRDWEITEQDPINLDHYEKKALLRALATTGGDKVAAARLLKVGKSTLYRKLKRFGI